MRRTAISLGIALLLVGCGLSVVGIESSEPGPDAGVVDASLVDARPMADASLDADADAGEADADVSDVAVPCTEGTLECCGGSACPAGSTSCESGVCKATITLSVNNDGTNDLVMSGTSVHWQNREYAGPSSANIDGQTWVVAWPGGDDRCRCASSAAVLAAPLAARASVVVVQKTDGRGTVRVVQQPTADAPTARIEVNDSASGQAGADDYTAIITYETR